MLSDSFLIVYIHAKVSLKDFKFLKLLFVGE